METKKSKLGLGIFIGVLIGLVIGLSSFIIYDKVINNKDNSTIKDNQNENNNTGNMKDDNNQEVKCDDCVVKIDENDYKAPTTEEIYAESFPTRTIERKVILANKIVTVKIEVVREEYKKEYDLYPTYYRILVEGKEIVKNYYTSNSDIEGIYVLNQDIIVIVTSDGYNSYNYHFIDENLKEIKTDFVIDKEYPISMKKNMDKKIELNDNKLIIYGTRLNDSNTINLEPNGVAIICSNGNNTSEFDKYKGQIIEAKYEIKYLGNGKFESTKSEVIRRLEENFCK